MAGVFGILGHEEAAELTYLGLYALQHRGQKSAGIACHDKNGHSHFESVPGLVEKFNPAQLSLLKGPAAIGQVTEDEQKVFIHRGVVCGASDTLTRRTIRFGDLSIAMDGRILNVLQLRGELEDAGAIFSTTREIEIVHHLLARSKSASLDEAVIEVMQSLNGAFSMILLANDVLYAMRDLRGIRPLSVVQLGESWILASETCAFDLVAPGCESFEVLPGGILKIHSGGMEILHIPRAKPRAKCACELVFYGRPDSRIFGHGVYSSRRKMGRSLARTDPVEADVVVPVPDSGFPFAIGYAAESNIPLGLGLVRSHYVGRGRKHFLVLGQSIGLKLKLNANPQVVKGKRVIVVDDSVLRGLAMPEIVKMLRLAGAVEVHVRVASAPIRHPCLYGVLHPKKGELIAASKDLEEIRQLCKADSLGFLDLGVMKRAICGNPDSFCSACWDGQYPIPPEI